MSGQNVPYQLRPNKFVERQLFLDVLDFVRVWNSPSRYIYVSMGGRFLEDFKLINDRFAIEHMISIESDETTWKRAAFNRLGFIDCRHESSGEFVESLERLLSEQPKRRLIVWLDYADANKRGEQLGEFRQLVSKLASGDVAKITLNANPQSYRRRAAVLTKKDFETYLKNPESPTHKDFDTYLASLLAPPAGEASGNDRVLALSDSEYETICIANLTEQLGEYLPVGQITPDQLETEAFARLLLQAVQLAALKGVTGSKLHVIPLAAYRYRDSEHQMVTVTTVLGDDELAARIKSDQVFAEWPFRSTDWTKVVGVSVPDMSVKERHLLEGLVSSDFDAAAIHNQMPFRFDVKESVSVGLLKAYLSHYRRYPSFVHVR